MVLPPTELALEKKKKKGVDWSLFVLLRDISITSTGLIRTHGPLRDRCLGSGKLPKQPNAASSQSSRCSGGTARLPRVRPTISPLSDVANASLEPIVAVQVLDRIPKVARHQCRLKLTTILNAVVSLNSVDAWNRLFQFPTRCLRMPARSRGRNSGYSLASRPTSS